MHAELPTVTKLDGTNYLQWREEMGSFLKSIDLWDIATEEEQEPQQEEEKREWKGRRDVAKGVIRLSIEPSQYWIVEEITTPKEIMDKLKARYDKPIRFTCFDLLCIKQAEGMSLSTYFATIGTQAGVSIGGFTSSPRRQREPRESTLTSSHT